MCTGSAEDREKVAPASLSFFELDRPAYSFASASSVNSGSDDTTSDEESSAS